MSQSTRMLMMRRFIQRVLSMKAIRAKAIMSQHPLPSRLIRLDTEASFRKCGARQLRLEDALTFLDDRASVASCVFFGALPATILSPVGQSAAALERSSACFSTHARPTLETGKKHQFGRRRTSIGGPSEACFYAYLSACA